MSSWPESLPGPQRKLTVEAGTNIKRRKLQSGRHEVRRFGTGAPDQVKVLFRLFHSDVGTFNHFYSRETNHGVNWFNAPWLPALGYDEHMGRFLGYPKCKKRGQYYSDFEASLLVQRTIHCPVDSFWPTAGDGGAGSGGPPQEGLVTVWGDNFRFVHDCPDDLQAVKVVISERGYRGAALKADGTVEMWGMNIYLYPGWENLTGIIDIAFAGYELLLLDAGGAVSSIGHGRAEIKNNIPAVAGATGIWGASQLAAVKDSDESLIYWGVPSWVAQTSTVSSAIHVSTNNCGNMGIIAIDENGVLVGGGGSQGFVPDTSNAVLSTLIQCSDGYGGNNLGVVFLDDGSWQGWNGVSGVDRIAPNVPPALEPIFLTGGLEMCLAIHQDDTVVLWGASYTTTWAARTALPAGLKATMADLMGQVDSNWNVTTAGAAIAI